jgi:crotonobetainyl-CoA:carnitine CoA-transferase CaiB-like acyl-CoA transferase
MLDSVRVLDCSRGVPGAYCTKLLADAGADVIKAEGGDGDPLRRWSAAGVELAPGTDGALFRFLHTSKRAVIARDGDLASLLAGADIVVESGDLDVDTVRTAHPNLVVVSITPYGRGLAGEDRPATEFTLQAECGSTGSRGRPDGPPLAAGGRIGEWVAGTYAAVAATAAVRAARRDGAGEHVDVSTLACMSVTMNTYASVFGEFLGWPEVRGPARTIEIPSIEPTADGYVGFCTITGQQFQDFLVLIERPDLLDDKDFASFPGRTRRMNEALDIIHAWTTKHATAEIIEQATALRIPVAMIGDGTSVTAFDHFVERGTFVAHPRADFVQPRVPYRIGGLASRPFTPAPRLGEHTGDVPWSSRENGTTPPSSARALPLEGVRVVDFTAFWAGPSATHMLAGLGADVIKVESVQRPDGMRFSSTRPPSVDRWWEWGPVFHGANANKRAVTLDMGRPEGLELAKQLIAQADAVVENFTPRVMENFGLSWDVVHATNPRALMVRMPAFGLDGPWRDRPGFAQTMEQISGMAWVTGFADGPPLIPRGACDPLAGMHAVLAFLLALAQRDVDGEGRLVEVTMVEAALNAAAEQVVEHGAYGVCLGRDGNHGPSAAPQNVYACAGDERWIAIAVESDAQWEVLRAVMGDPAWAREPSLATVSGRRAAHQLVDDELARWCASEDADDLVERLVGAGIPAAVVIHPRDVSKNPRLRARGFFESLDHDVVGRHELPSLPFRFASRGDAGWLRRPAPTVGQHNDEVFGELLGLDDVERTSLRSERIAGERPLGL